MFTNRVCVMGRGSPTAKIMILGEAPGANEERTGRVFSGAAGEVLDRALQLAGFSSDEVYISNVVKCRPPDNRAPELVEIKACAGYLDAEIAALDPSHILLLGNAALKAVARKSGITKQRGVRLAVKGHEGRTIMAAFHPAYALRNPGIHPTFVEDVRRFARAVAGELRVKPVKKKLVGDIEAVKRLRAALLALPPDTLIAYDFEDRYAPWHKDWSATCLGFSWDGHTSYVVPLYHPESPFKRDWLRILKYFKPAMERRDLKWVAQSGKHDNIQAGGAGIWMEHKFDLMLATHLVDENRPKGLKFLAQTYLGADEYKGDLDLKPDQILKTDLRTLMVYNGNDVGYSHQLHKPIKADLLKNPRHTRLFAKLMMPASHVLQKVEWRGMYVDQERLWERIPIIQQAVEERKAKMIETVPKSLREDMNFNSTQKVAKWLYSKKGLGLECVIFTEKGNPSTNEEAVQNYIDHPMVKLLLEYRTLQLKWLNTYTLAWAGSLDSKSRIHTWYKLYGTVTGRVSGDLQQVPRDHFIRSIIGAPPGWVFISADYSQIELRVAAHCAQEPTMIRYFLTGRDIHAEMAARILGKRVEDLKKEERKMAKPVNFGYLYGMYPAKFQKYAKINYGVDFTMAECEVSRKMYFEQFPALEAWHERQRRRVHTHHRVTSPLGRTRHLPDILSPDRGVQMEAERQAINSPVSSCASDLMLFSMVQLDPQLDPRECAMVMTLHDGIGFECKEDKVDKYLPIIKETMETLPLQKTFGLTLRVPIEAEVEYDTHWVGNPDASGLGFS
jgi:DNA polymerase-1